MGSKDDTPTGPLEPAEPPVQPRIQKVTCQTSTGRPSLLTPPPLPTRELPGAGQRSRRGPHPLPVYRPASSSGCTTESGPRPHAPSSGARSGLSGGTPTRSTSEGQATSPRLASPLTAEGDAGRGEPADLAVNTVDSSTDYHPRANGSPKEGGDPHTHTGVQGPEGREIPGSHTS